MTIIITKFDIISAIAYCGIQQSPHLFPENLDGALIALEKRIDERRIFKSPRKKNDVNIFLEIEQSELMPLIRELIFNTPEISIWNVTKMERETLGITDHKDAKRPVKLSGTSRYGEMQPEDMDFIDLDALSQNVCNMILNAQ